MFLIFAFALSFSSQGQGLLCHCGWYDGMAFTVQRIELYPVTIEERLAEYLVTKFKFPQVAVSIHLEAYCCASSSIISGNCEMIERLATDEPDGLVFLFGIATSRL